MAGLRFQAEHAHVLPTNNQGWYFYHKSKNYNVMLNGIKTGIRMGTKICFWGTTFLVVEQGTDHLRGTADFMSTGWAGLMISGAFSAWSMLSHCVESPYIIDGKADKFPSHTAARTLKTGLFSGLAFGLAQDALGLLRGRRLGYVDFLLGREDPADPVIGVQGV